MEIRKTSKLLGCTALMALALLSGCGGTSTTTTIPSTATIFYGHNIVFRNNTAMTMGYNGFGQLGLGNLVNTPSASPVPFTGPVSGGATGGEHTLAFGNRSTISAWGYNLYGQLGTPTVATGSFTSSYSAVAQTVHGFNGAIVTSVAAGGYHSLAVAGGVVYGWGFNGYGQVGNNSFSSMATPVQVLDGVGLAPLNTASSVAAGGSHSLALMNDGKIWGWGRNNFGQLGFDPLLNNASYKAAVPLVLPGGRTALKVAAGGSNSYALANDHTVWAWGYNGDGELGMDPAKASFSFDPVQVMKDADVAAPAVPSVPLFASKIAVGGNHVLVMQSDASGVPDGTLWAWGYNGFAQLGNNAILNKFAPVQVLSLPAGTVRDIRAFGDYSMAEIATTNIQVGKAWYGWGDNEFGQLGNPIATTTIGYLLVPTLVLGNLP